MAAAESKLAQMSFEQALARLEQIVQKLEAGDVSLEDSIALYSEGAALRTHCTAQLAQAQARIEQLQISPEGQVAGAQPFDAG